MIRLDTHVVVWLYIGETERLSRGAAERIDSEPPTISPMVELELTHLHEIGRLSVSGAEIVADLANRIGLRVSDARLAALVAAAAPLGWTRDPFDRLIAADAIVAAAPLLTKDETLLANVPLATW